MNPPPPGRKALLFIFITYNSLAANGDDFDTLFCIFGTRGLVFLDFHQFIFPKGGKFRLHDPFFVEDTDIQ